MKGIILAGGVGSRLYPLTIATTKHLLPIYDKPMIYYPLSVLMLAQIKDVLIISTPIDLPRIQMLLGDGSRFGMNFSYKEQPSPDGLAQAFTLGEDFIKDEACALILGDNVFYGSGLISNLKESIKRAEVDKIATIYAYYVQNANRFGIVELDENNKAISIEEKPGNPKSNYAVTGLYFYPAGVAQKAKEIKPSERNEFEITDLNKIYLEENRLYVSVLGRGYSWFDAGTHESLSEASESIRILENRQGLKVCCPEEIAYINGWISKENLLKQAEIMKENPYGQHLYNVALGKIKY